MQPHDDDDHTRQDAETIGIGPDQRAEQAGRGTQRDEHGRESGNKQQGQQNRRRRAPVLAHLVQRLAGEIDKIGRHQRQDAGAEKGQETGNERGRS